MKIQYFLEFHEFDSASQLKEFIDLKQSKKGPYGAYWLIEDEAPTLYLFLNGQWATLGHRDKGKWSESSEPCDNDDVDFMIENGQVDPLPLDATVWDYEGIAAFVHYADTGEFDSRICWGPS